MGGLGSVVNLAQQQREVLQPLGAAAGRLVQRQLEEGEGEASREAQVGHGAQRGQAGRPRRAAEREGAATGTTTAPALRRDWQRGVGGGRGSGRRRGWRERGGRRRGWGTGTGTGNAGEGGVRETGAFPGGHAVGRSGGG